MRLIFASKITPTIRRLFGEVDYKKMADIMLSLLFFLTLFSATCFFFDSHQMHIFGYLIHFPVGLLFFPATYVISNIIQDRNGRTYANTVVLSGFLADVVLVSITWLIAHAGDRTDYLSVFDGLPIIMGATFVFLSVSSIFNTFIFELTKKIRKKSILGAFLGFFSSITVAELLVTSMSMPLLFIKQGLTGNVVLTILITVAYKVVFNFLAGVGYVYYISRRHGEKGAKHTVSKRSDLAKIA